LNLSPAVRFDRIQFRGGDHRRSDQELNPHIGLSLTRVQPYLVTVKAGWGRSFRAPTFADLFYQDVRVRGNPEIQAEVSENRDIGVLTGVPLLGWLETEVDYFRRNVDNLIVWRMGSFAAFSPYNTDALISGWEYRTQWTSRSKRLRISLDHMILDPVNKSGDRTTHNKRLPYQASHTTKLGLVLSLRYVSIDYHKRLVGDRYVTEANTVRMEPYSADDVSLTCSIPWERVDMKMTISVFNLFDEAYEMIERTPLPGRYWRGGMEVSF
jgi:outer membrane cobalamin receptor